MAPEQPSVSAPTAPNAEAFDSGVGADSSFFRGNGAEPAVSARRGTIRVVDVYNTDKAAKSLGMYRAERTNQSGRYENLILCGNGPYVAALKERGIRVLNAPIPRRIAPLAMLRCAKQMANLLRDQDCTIIHSHGSTAAVCARLAARAAGIPWVIHTVHGFHFHSGMRALRRRLYVAAERYLTRYTDLLLFQNQEDLDESRQYNILARRGNIKVGNGINLHRIAAMGAKAPADPPVILSIGRFEKVKNHEMLLRGARLLRDRGVRFQLWLAGTGPLLEHCKGVAAQLGVADCTRFLGYVDDVLPLVKQATVATLTSIKEGIPRGLLEPMAMGIPVVATNVKGNRDTVENGATGWLVPLDDDKALADALHVALTNDSLRNRLGQAAAEVVRQEFDEDRVVDRLLDVYDSLLEPAGQSRLPNR